MLEIVDHGEIREIRLARPPANAFNPQLTDALHGAVEAAGRDAGAVVVSGRAGMFSAGLDVPELMALDRARMTEFWHSFLRMLHGIATTPVPVAFAMTGHAPAGGIVTALFGDYRIMPRGSFKTGFNEVQVGLVVPPQVHRALVRLVGAHTAERILVAGEIMDAQRALRIGLVDEIADDPEQVRLRAIEWCRELLAVPRTAMLISRAMARADLHRLFEGDYNAARFVDVWFEESTQRTLRGLVERLTGKT
jgi:enoyl-CoA hydratase/carnithine racemase